MNRLIVQLIICFGCMTFGSCREEIPPNSEFKLVESKLEHIQKHYAPDSRDHKFEFQLSTSPTDSQSFDITGYTTVAEAVDAAQSLIESENLPIHQMEIRLLPDMTQLEGKPFGIIKVSIANLRSKPGHSQELATQLLHGMPVWLLDRQDDWYLVRCADNYLAWLNKGDFEAVDHAQLNDYLSRNLFVYTGGDIRLTAYRGDTSQYSPTPTVPIDLSPGAIVEVVYDEVDIPQLKTIDDRRAAVTDLSDLMTIERWSEQDISRSLSNVNYSLGRPYLWGGTSTRAADCSGFTKMCFYMAGFIIPRDASQQVKIGEEVPLDDELTNLESNDLIFFGRLREDGSQRITHVALYDNLRDGTFFHAGADNGFIKSQSLKPDRPDYAPHRRESLLAARRYTHETAGLIRIGDVLSIDFWGKPL
ncbi:MAG: C40 family peptidase [Bacteroidota bacterium]